MPARWPPLLHGAPGVAPRPTPARKGASLSAVTWAMRVRTKGFPLVRHNVFFDHRLRQRVRRRVPSSGACRSHGTVYLCARRTVHDDQPDFSDDGLAAERLLMLVNAPRRWRPTRDFTDDPETEACQDPQPWTCCDAAASQLHDRPPEPRCCVAHRPTFHRLYPGTGGALYGPSTHGWMALFKRGLVS